MSVSFLVDKEKVFFFVDFMFLFVYFCFFCNFATIFRNEAGSIVYESQPRKQRASNKNYQERVRPNALTFLWILRFGVNLVDA